MKNIIKSDAPLTAKLWFELEKTLDTKIELIKSFQSYPPLPKTPLEPTHWYMNYVGSEVAMAKGLKRYASNFTAIMDMVYQELPEKEKEKIDTYLEKQKIQFAQDFYDNFKDEDGPHHLGNGKYLHSDGIINANSKDNDDI
jgi:hypothetical protein